MSKSLPWPQLLLVTATLIWGSSFLVMKQAVSALPVFTLLALRFTIAAALLGLVFWKKWKLLTKKALAQGALIGTLIFLAYVLQTYGLSGLGSWEGTTPGKNAFLTAVYCVLVPFFAWMFFQKRPDRYNVSAALLCLFGIGLVSLNARFTVVGGDILTLLGGIAFALHIVAVSHFCEKSDVILLTILQFVFMAAESWLGVLLTRQWPVALPTGGDFLRLIYLAVAASALAMLFQNVGEAHTPPATAAVLLSMEAPFGVLFSVLFGDERPTAAMYAGFALIFCAVLLSETKLSFLSRKKQKIPS